MAATKVETALAQEQRTANLIAYAMWRQSNGQGVEASVVEAIRERLEIPARKS